MMTKMFGAESLILRNTKGYVHRRKKVGRIKKIYGLRSDQTNTDLWCVNETLIVFPYLMVK